MSSLPPDTKIAVFGIGNMGEAVVAGLIRTGIKPSHIRVSEPNPGRLADMVNQYGVRQAPSTEGVLSDVSAVLLAVKPKDIPEVCAEIAESLPPEALVMSVAAGITIDELASYLPPEQPIIRVMPNTPAQIGAGISALSPGEYATDDDVALAAQLLAGCGDVVVVPESQQSAIAALSGSGPAYVFYFIDALAEAGVAAGLPRALSIDLAIQTVAGSAKLLKSTGQHPVLARERVTSPGGTTAVALRELDAGAVRATILKAVDAAVVRSTELSKFTPNAGS